jgi:cell fate regulator YaaT (PSP1 superfamily)
MDVQRDEPIVLVKLCCSGRPHPCLVVRGSARKPLGPGTPVVVESEAGLAFGRVAGFLLTMNGPHGARADGAARLLRVATEDDIAIRRRQEVREREAFRVGLMKIRERGLAMKLTRVEQLYDGSRLVFYFTAEGRVDFRELVRELATEFRSRIEMRQIGVRDEARMLGGYGSCGRPLCCSAWLQSFEPVSIKMAKQQDLSLNPAKLSGLCGRLKCCLRYELPEGKLPRKAVVHDQDAAELNGQPH